MYDDLADIYDRFIDWPTRLARELPALLAWLDGAHRVADVACGTGRHALALAEAGKQVVGFDLSAEALDRARQAAGGRVRFVQAPFGTLAARVDERFDAALCLGNSLPHVLGEEALSATVDDLAQLLVPGGRLLLQMRNLPLAAARGERWLPLKGHTDPDGTEWVFERLYDYLPERRIAFHFVALFRPPGGTWQRRVETTQLRAWRPDDLRLVFGGWAEVKLAANLAGAEFKPDESGDLVVLARR